MTDVVLPKIIPAVLYGGPSGGLEMNVPAHQHVITVARLDDKYRAKMLSQAAKPDDPVLVHYDRYRRTPYAEEGGYVVFAYEAP